MGRGSQQALTVPEDARGGAPSRRTAGIIHLIRRQLRSKLKARLAIVLLAALVVLVLLLDSKRTEVFRLESVVFDADAQGYAWPHSPVMVTFNRRLPEEWLDERLRASPPVAFDISVEHTGRWLRKTRFTIKPAYAEGFATDTVYRFYLTRPYFSFTLETIPTPKVARAEPNGHAVKTTEPLVLAFDRPMDERAPLQIASMPEVALEPLWYGDRALVLQHQRLANATEYEVVLSAGIDDADGHPMQEEFRFSFKTVDPPTVAEFGPQGQRVGLRDGVRVTFSTGVDRTAVEAAFQMEPPAEGSFDWPDEKTLVWRPNHLRPGQSYHIRVGGRSLDGDAVVPAEWRFRTLVPPPQITPGGDGKLILTFDDDPLALGRASELLDILARYRARTILFPTGAWAAANPDFVARARAEGHLVCNHTYGHADLTTLSEEAARFQILNGAGADQCNLLRPPYAARNDAVDALAASLGYRIYMWTVDSRDWEGLSAREIANTVLNNILPGAVVLFHLHAAHTLEALPAIIEAAQGAGYVLSY